jgi:hypothetical protein
MPTLCVLITMIGGFGTQAAAFVASDIARLRGLSIAHVAASS